MSQEKSKWRRRSVLVLATTTAILGAAGITMAAGTSTASFKFTPSTVPKHRFRAGALTVHSHTAFTRDTQTDRIRFNFDDHFRFAPRSVPSCNPSNVLGSIDMAQAMARCGSTKVGSGTMQFAHATETYNGCILAFNRTPLDRPPRILLLMRAEVAPSPATIDCSNPRANHNGNVTVLLQGTLRRGETRPDYRVQLDLNHIAQATPLPITDLVLTLDRGSYVSARCATEDSVHGWQLRTRIRYANPRKVQTLDDSAQRCGAV
jgi:hypothetical protein